MQAFSYLIIAATDILLYFAAKKKIWPVLVYIPLQIFFEGNGMWPDQLLAPLLLICYLSLKSKNYFLLGLFLGLALLTKQTAIYFVVAVLLLPGHRIKILLGVFSPIILTFIYLLVNQTWPAFYEQTIVYIFGYHVGNIAQQLWPNLVQTIVMAIVFLPGLATGVLQKNFLLVALTVFASLGMFTRFSYFHLQPALPFLALLITSKLLAVPAFALMIIFLSKNLFLEPKFLNQQILDNAKAISQYIPPGEKTLILSSHDHYYWLTKTRPVGNFFTTSTPWNLAYPGVSEKIIAGLVADHPKYIVFEKGPAEATGYILGNYQPMLKLADGASIFEYNPVGLGQKL